MEKKHTPNRSDFKNSVTHTKSGLGVVCRQDIWTTIWQKKTGLVDFKTRSRSPQSKYPNIEMMKVQLKSNHSLVRAQTRTMCRQEAFLQPTVSH